MQGVDFDAFVSNADVNSYNLEAIRVPTLIVHTKDDPLVSFEAAERAAGRISGARLVRRETGGHLLLGQTDAIQRELASFLGAEGGKVEDEEVAAGDDLVEGRARDPRSSAAFETRSSTGAPAAGAGCGARARGTSSVAST